MIRESLPYWVKKILRFVKYKEERSSFFREIRIRGKQDQNLKSNFNQNANSLILFFVPGADRSAGKETISGGVMSLVSLCEETLKLENIHGAKTLMCTFPRQFLLLKHVNFDNKVDVYRLDQFVGYFKSVKKIIIHLPDDMVSSFFSSLLKSERKWLQDISEVHINIVNANILLMPTPEVIKDIGSIATKITMTAAHSKYCNSYYRKYYGVPLHKFSTWVSHEQYSFKTYSEKENVIVISPDDNPNKKKVLSILMSQTDLEIITLQGMTHSKFKETIGYAKWALTFGEGLDGYLVEPIFSGSFAFAVYNEDFFTEDYKKLKGIYPTYDDMAINILNDIRQLDDANVYMNYQKQQFDLCSKDYSYSQYQDNIKQFYLGNYTFL
jgi:hypothetical protein